MGGWRVSGEVRAVWVGQRGPRADEFDAGPFARGLQAVGIKAPKRRGEMETGPRDMSRGRTHRPSSGYSCVTAAFLLWQGLSHLALHASKGIGGTFGVSKLNKAKPTVAASFLELCAVRCSRDTGAQANTRGAGKGGNKGRRADTFARRGGSAKDSKGP